MSLQRILVFCIALALILVALVKRTISSKAARVNGNAVLGTNLGTINQTYHQSNKAAASGQQKSLDFPSDRVAIAIGIVGVLIAAAQLSLDFFR